MAYSFVPLSENDWLPWDIAVYDFGLLGFAGAVLPYTSHIFQQHIHLGLHVSLGCGLQCLLSS